MRDQDGVWLRGLTHLIAIRDFRGKDERYMALMKSLIDNGHSFAVHGGHLYLSASATQRLIDEGRVDSSSLDEVI